MVEQELKLIKVKCEKCKAQYYIKWINITLAKKYSVEFCPNCGESELLEVEEEYNIPILKINKMLNEFVKEEKL